MTLLHNLTNKIFLHIKPTELICKPTRGWHTTEVRASHPATPGSILGVPKNYFRRVFLTDNFQQVISEKLFILDVAEINR